MTTKLLLQIREQVKSALDEKNTLIKERDVRQAEGDELIKRAETEKRDMDSKESARFREIGAQLRQIDDQLDNESNERPGINQRLAALQERETELVAYEESRERATKAAEQWADRAASADVVAHPAKVRSEARTYTPESAKRGVSFFRDVAQRFVYSEPEAASRLERHIREARLHEAAGYESRDIGTGAFAGLTVPQYLTDLVAPVARAMAPTVGICNRHPLTPTGMTVNISRITTGVGVDVQATENAAVTETDQDDTLLTVNVRTYSGQQDLSRQALERGTGTDEITMEDLTRAYWTRVDNAILNSDGTGGTHLGIRSTGSIVTVTYTDGTPTGAEAYRTLPELISGIQSGVFMGVTHFVMHPRRWWWLCASVGTSFPLLHAPNVDTVQAGNIGGTEYMAQNRNILGIPVIVDGNMATNLGAGTEDVIIAVTNTELHFWDDGVQFIRAEQPGAGNLTVKFVLYGYSAFTAGRYPGAHGLITGTGLIAPVFTTA